MNTGKLRSKIDDLMSEPVRVVPEEELASLKCHSVAAAAAEREVHHEPSYKEELRDGVGPLRDAEMLEECSEARREDAGRYRVKTSAAAMAETHAPRGECDAGKTKSPANRGDPQKFRA